jgi:poly(A) polymerase
MNYGVAVPLSIEFPTPDEILHNEHLRGFLFQVGNLYETIEGSQERTAIFETLKQIAYLWSFDVGLKKGLPVEKLNNGNTAQLRIFGSTRLGVQNSRSDIDILCLAPPYVTKADFFTSFIEVISKHSEVEQVLSVPEAYTPVLKFMFAGQAIDMVFASLHSYDITNDLNILDVKYLSGMDDPNVRSFNGARVAEWICRLVPNINTFCEALRVIKYWARQRGIYSNMLGFLGGVNYAILVALICQLYVNACPYVLVRNFFAVFAHWPWPTPVMLSNFEDLRVSDSGGKYLTVWNPKSNYSDACHIMPIITPAYPAMNSAYNVAPSQFRAIQV